MKKFFISFKMLLKKRKNRHLKDLNSADKRRKYRYLLLDLILKFNL